MRCWLSVRPSANRATTSASGSGVSFTNGTGATFSGILATGDTTTLTNNGTMYLYSGSGIGTYYSTGGTSQVTDNGLMYIGTTSTPSILTVGGNFTNSSTGNLFIPVVSSGTVNSSGVITTTAGTNYSQVSVTGTATLAGTLNVQVNPGFYYTGSTYKLITANSISGNFSTVNYIGTTTSTSTTDTSKTSTYTTVNTTAASSNGVLTVTTVTATSSGTTTTVTTSSSPLFVTFSAATGTLSDGSVCNNGVCTTTSGTQAYEIVASHNSYATVIKNNTTVFDTVGNNRIAIAGGLDKVLATATTALAAGTTTDAATLLGEVDVLSLADAQAFLDALSPEGYLAYAQALRDQANVFERSIDLRMNDQNSQHPEDGWWMSMQGQGDFASTASTVGGYRTRDHLIGMTGGYDFSGPNHVVGAAFNITWDSLHYAPATLTGTNRDFAVALYGKQKLGMFYASGQLAYNNGHLSSTKTLTIGSYTRSASASAGESLFVAKGELGIDAKLGGWTLTPFAGIDFKKGSISGFTESNAGAADLTVSSINADRTDLLAGVSLQRSHGMFRPYARVAYRSAMGSAGVNTVTAYLNGESDSSFTVTGLAPAKTEVDTNIGVNWVFDDAGALFVGYQGTMRSNYTSHGVNLGIRLEF